MFAEERGALRQIRHWRATAAAALVALFWRTDGRARCVVCRADAEELGVVGRYAPPEPVAGATLLWWGCCVACLRGPDRRSPAEYAALAYTLAREAFPPVAAP